MGKLLYIQASPMAELSYSIAVADAFVDEYRRLHPGDAVATLNVCDADLPAFGAATARGKYAIMHGRPHTAAERAAWEAVEKVIADFKSADKYVLAVPMWNFGIPYRLKQYFDLIVQPTYTFSFDPATGYTGQVTGRPAFVAYARGGEYPEGSPAAGMDHQKPYVDMILRFMGITDIRSVVIEPTLMAGPDVAAAKRKEAVEQARKMARKF